jgi:protein SCO1
VEVEVKRGALILAVLALCAGCGGSKKQTFVGQALPGPPLAPAFTLNDDTGRAMSLASQRGHYVIVTFLYTHCRDVCPIIAGNLNLALKTPTAKQAGLTVLAVSVDPKGDTAAAVRTYMKVRALVPRFHYLIGTHAQLAPVWKGYHIGVEATSKTVVGHSSFEFLIDPTGHERLLYGKEVQPGWIVGDLKKLMGAS